MSANMEQCLWKTEMVSSSETPSADIDNAWLTDNLLENAVNEDEPVLYDEHHTRAEVATKLLSELDELIKEEPLNDWFEEKVNFSIFDGFPLFTTEHGQESKSIPIDKLSKSFVQPHQLSQSPQQQQETTNTLLQEFESILGDVEACYQSQCNENVTLTPPLTPNKHSSNEEMYTFVIPETIQQENLILVADDNEQTCSIVLDNPTPVVLSPEFVSEKELPEQWEAEKLSVVSIYEGSNIAMDDEECSSLVSDDISCSLPSPCSNISSYSPSCASTEDATDDPDWSEITYEKSTLKRSASRRQRKPYSKESMEEKRVRKKEQNKNAATRYRQKKKQEVIEIIGEEEQLKGRNDQLKAQVTDLQREIGYLKGLMRELFKAKGLIK